MKNPYFSVVILKKVFWWGKKKEFRIFHQIKFLYFIFIFFENKQDSILKIDAFYVYYDDKLYYVWLSIL